MPGKIWPSAAPAPQLFSGPQVDRIHERGVAHWRRFREDHGFHGVHLTCAGRPLHNSGIRALVESMPYTWIWLLGDRQAGQVPFDDVVEDPAALAYYRTVYDLLGHLGPDRWGVALGYDLFEWVDPVTVGQWVNIMRDLDPHEGRMIGGRARWEDVDQPEPLPGSYAGFGAHVVDKGRHREICRRIVARSAGRPSFAEDRYRERPGNRGKDWNQRQMLDPDEGMLVCVEERVAAVWAVFRDGADQDGGSDYFDDPGAVRALLEGSQPPPPPDDDCCGLACRSGFEIRRLREGFTRDVIQPVRAGLDGIEPPIGIDDLVQIGRLVPRLLELVPVAEDYAAQLRDVEDQLVLTCEEPPPDDDDGNGGDEEPPPPPGEPTINVLEPGTAAVQSWPVVQAPRFEVTVRDDEVLLRFGEVLDESTWPGFEIDFMQPGEGEPVEHHGNAWMIYPDLDAEPVEWLKSGERERRETTFPLDKLPDIPDGAVVGFMLCGPSRHLGNESRFRRRTLMRFYHWGAGRLRPAPTPS